MRWSILILISLSWNVLADVEIDSLESLNRSGQISIRTYDLQLSMADSDSLESLAEQKLLIDKYKANQEREKKVGKSEAETIAKRNQIKADLESLRSLEVRSLEKLKELQRNKVEILAQIEVNKLGIQKRETENSLSRALESPAGTWKRYARKRMFVEPVKGYLKYQKEDKGLEFECLDQCKILAPATGFVVYIGDLAPYGKIIMLSHTEGFRSVFLGDMKYSIKKNQKVYQGNLIGRVEGNPLASVYYELRKNSKPQEIFNYIPFL